MDGIGKLSLCHTNCIGLSPDTKLHVACVLPPTSSSSGKWKDAIFGGSVGRKDRYSICIFFTIHLNFHY